MLKSGDYILQLLSIKFWNAAANYAYNLSDALFKLHKIKSIFIIPSTSRANEKIKNNFDTINFDLRSANIFKLIFYAHQVKKICIKNNIKIINCHYGEALLVASLSKILFKNPAKIIRTVVDVREPKKNFINKYLFKNIVDHFIISCTDTKSRYQKNFPFLYDDKFTLIYYGHDSENYANNFQIEDLKSKLNIPENSFIVSTIARLSPEKGHKFLLEIANKVIKKQPNIYFIIAGEQITVKWDHLLEIAKNYEIDKNLIYINHPNDVRNIINITNVGLITSQSSEAACRIATEFFSFGKPVVATNPNVLKEMIKDNETGFLINIDDVEKGVESILKLYNDKNLYFNISQNNKLISQTKYNSKNFAEEHLKVFEKVLIN